MELTNCLTTVSLLVRDTFRQSFASGISWVLLGLSTVCILVCLSVSVSGPVSLGPPGENPDFLPRSDPESGDAEKIRQSGVSIADGALTLAFGAVRVPVAHKAQSAVHFLELILAGGIADTLGLLLALVWTAGFLPAFLDPRGRFRCCWPSRFGEGRCCWASTLACWPSSWCRPPTSSPVHGWPWLFARASGTPAIS